MPLSLVEAPTSEPLTVAQAAKQTETEGTTDHEAFLQDTVIPAARERCEGATRRQLVGPATWDWWLDGFPCTRVIELPRPPLLAVSSVKYYDTAGVLQTFAASNYIVQALAGPKCRRGRLGLKETASWPTDVAVQIGAVVIRFTCGYGDAAKVPPLLLQAMLMDVSTMFEFRENLLAGSVVEIPKGTADIYRSFKSHGTQWIEE